MHARMRASGIALIVLAACGGDHTATPDAGAGPVTTERCVYEPMTPTANAGGTVAAGALMAGAAEQILDVPVGTALGGYTARAGFLGTAGVVDTRKVKISGTFNPSIGVEVAPRVKAVALTADAETVVIVKIDAIFIYEGMLFDLEQRLGPSFAGKVIIASSHSHSAWAQFTAQGPLKLGAGELRQLVYNRFLDTMEATARAALAARRPAQLGVSFDGGFDPTDQVNRDRRPENDTLPGGNVKDNHLYLVRIDGIDGKPIAAIPIFGEHGTLNSEDNPFASTDAPGALERVMQEQFDDPIVVMHLQSAGGDNSPTPHGGLDCNIHPGKATDPCLSWATVEGHGRAAVPFLMTAYTAAGANMQSTLELAMLSRSIDTGPDPTTFSIRDGALAYRAFDLSMPPDGVIYDGNGALISPIDEFNAPVGAGLCESDQPMFPAADIPGTTGILPYGSCLRLDVAGAVLGPIFNVDFKVDENHPVCETTRTTISALKLGDYIIATMPGELTVMLATYMRSKSPLDEAHTILVGYSQGHTGYMLRPEDWMMGGYEPSVTFWGPLQAEMIGEKVLDLMPLALLPTRQDGTTAGTTKVQTVTTTDDLDIDDPAPMAGTVPTTIPSVTWARTGTPTVAQPAAQIARVSGVATFTWIGDDPAVQTPHVTLQTETTPGVFADAQRRSGRIVNDAEIPVAYTPVPLQRGTGPQTHMWVVEWQAVPWLGEVGLDTLDQRGGVPLGNYRFHVEGKGWTLDSQPFQVVPGGLEISSATRNAGMITADVAWHAVNGSRLMDMNLNSNDPVPVRSQAVTVVLVGAAGTLATVSGTTDAAGKVTVPDNAAATTAQITDAFGNVATVNVQ